jgi:hypothetical protein
VLEPGCDDLHYDFVDYVAEGDRSEVFGIGNSFFFLDEGMESGVEGW